MTKQKLRIDIVHKIMELRNKDLIDEDSILDVLDDCLNPFIDEMEEETKNDYLFHVKISDKKGGNVREIKGVVSAKNIESAYKKISDKLFENDIIVYSIIDVKKL